MIANVFYKEIYKSKNGYVNGSGILNNFNFSKLVAVF